MGGLFGPDPENKVKINWLIWNLVLVMVYIELVNIQNFKLLAFLLLETKKFVCLIFLEVSFRKQLQQPQLVNRILLKCPKCV